MYKYFLNDTEIKFGDQIQLCGVNLIFTEKIYNLNKDHFKREEEIRYFKCVQLNETIHLEVYRDFTVNKIYPGIVTPDGYLNLTSNSGESLSSISAFIKDESEMTHSFTYFIETHKMYYIIQESLLRYKTDDIIKDLNSKNFKLTNQSFQFREGVLYYDDHILFKNNQWAEVVNSPVCYLEDGLPVYENDSLYYINNFKICDFEVSSKFNGISPNVKYFRKIQEAVKELRNLQNSLTIEYFERFIGLSTYTEINLKQYYPREYARIVLKEIVKLLSPNFTPTYGNTKYFISKGSMGEIAVRTHESVIYDLVYFQTISDAQLAIKIMGEYIKYVV